MCFNVSLSKDPDFLQRRFNAKFLDPDTFEPMYHSPAFSTPKHPVISNERKDTIQLFDWGLIPHRVKDSKSADDIRFKTFNARSETVFEKPSFRSSIRKRRCLILVDGFFEYHHFKSSKYPYYIYLKDEDAFAFAGIWERWSDPESGEVRNTFSIVTTKANPLLERIHNSKKRMPVILKRDYEARWLDDELDMEEVKRMLVAFDENEIGAHTVSKLISSRGGNKNVKEVTKRYSYDELKPPDLDLF